MRYRIGITALLLSVSVLAFSQAAHHEGDWTTMFNGKNLDGWRTNGNWFAAGDGVLAIEPREGEHGWQRYDDYIWYEKPYGDFVLELEFKIPKKGNSGVFFRVGDVKDPVKTGIEVQILDSHGKPDDKMTHHDNGGVIRTAPPSKNASKPAGQWNQLRIAAKGSNLKVKLNGEQIIDIDLSKTASKDKPLTGAIGLQDHGLPLKFRNIRIKPL